MAFSYFSLINHLRCHVLGDTDSRVRGSLHFLVHLHTCICVSIYKKRTATPFWIRTQEKSSSLAFRRRDFSEAECQSPRKPTKSGTLHCPFVTETVVCMEKKMGLYDVIQTHHKTPRSRELAGHAIQRRPTWPVVKQQFPAACINAFLPP